MKITTGVIMRLIGDIGAILTAEKVLDAAGDFANPVSPEAIARAASDIEKLLVSHGVVVNGNIEQAIQALPMIFPLIGLK